MHSKQPKLYGVLALLSAIGCSECNRVKLISFTDLKCDYTLSEEYRKTHYLPGLLLQELKQALNETKEVRRCAINVLRDQFAKHAFDDRYASKVNIRFDILVFYHNYLKFELSYCTTC